jgi:hypothetical protein
MSTPPEGDHRSTLTIVMPAHVAGIHVLLSWVKQDVDGRDEARP